MEFTIEVQLSKYGSPVANKSYSAAHLVDGEANITTDQNGMFSVELADGEQFTVYGIETGIAANGTEVYYDEAGTRYEYGDADGKWYAGFDAPEYWNEDLKTTDNVTTMTMVSMMTKSNIILLLMRK